MLPGQDHGGSVEPESHDRFHLLGLHFTREQAKFVALNGIRGGLVIMAGSGMGTGGRVRHHLEHNLGREESSVVFVGYAAEGTLARQIIHGAAKVHLFGEEIPVRARVYDQRVLRARPAYSDEFVQRFRGYSSTDSNLKSSTRSNGFRPSLGASATARLLLPGLI